MLQPCAHRGPRLDKKLEAGMSDGADRPVSLYRAYRSIFRLIMRDELHLVTPLDSHSVGKGYAQDGDTVIRFLPSNCTILQRRTVLLPCISETWLLWAKA